jgi:hypothetical protein
MTICRACLVWALMLFAHAAHAASASGIWSGPSGAYLVLMEQSSSGAVIALSVSPTLQSATVWQGTHEGDTVHLRSLDGASSLTMALSYDSYSGTLTTAGATTPTSGQQLLAYAGSTQDGIWQRTGSGDRYLATVSVVSSGLHVMVVVDVRIAAGTAGIAVDVSTGLLQTLAGVTAFAGKSLLSGATVALDFAGGTPATVAYRSSTGRPPSVVEQFDAARVFQFD